MATSNGHAFPSQHGKQPRASPTPSSSLLSDPISRPANVPRKASRTSAQSLNGGEAEVPMNGEAQARVKGQSSKDSMSSRRSARRVSSIDSENPVAHENAKIQHEAQLATIRTLRADVETLRSIVTCKICTRLLYEPYTVSCGHTFCYSCLRQWFLEQHAKKPCPVCRADVKQLPAPAYLIRELIDTFVSRKELLPSDESLEDHQRLRQEEKDCVEKDRANKDPRTGGLFKGCFRITQPSEIPARAVRDQEDGVDRCPVCHWEIEDNRCAGCGLRFDTDGHMTLGRGSFSGISEYSYSEYGSAQSYHSDEDYDRDMDIDELELGSDYSQYPRWSVTPEYIDDDPYATADASDIYSFPLQRELADGYIQRPSRPASRSSYGSRMRRHYTQSIVSDMRPSEEGSMATVEEEDEEEDEEDSNLSGFIVNTDESDQSNGTMQSPSSRASSYLSNQTPQSNSTSLSHHSRQSSTPRHGMASSSLDEDDDEGGPISNGRRRQRRGSSPNARRPHRFGPVTSSVSSNNDHEDRDIDGDTQSLLQSGYARLEHDDADGVVEYDSEDEVRTTIGGNSPPLQAAEIRRLGGSITPTANNPQPRIRPPSRGTNRRRTQDGSRGLRRKGSTRSISHYDDEADDSDSDLEIVQPSVVQSGPLSGSARQGSSAASAQTRRTSATVPNTTSRGQSAGDAIELDSDSTSDQSIRPPRRRRNQHSREPEYNPRISMLFAQHQSNLESVDAPNRDFGTENRSITPIQRPRTASRNGSHFSPYQNTNQNSSSRQPVFVSPNAAESRFPPTDSQMRNPLENPTNHNRRFETVPGSSPFSPISPIGDNLSSNGDSSVHRNGPISLPTNELSVSAGGSTSSASNEAPQSPRSVSLASDRAFNASNPASIGSMQNRPAQGLGRSYPSSNYSQGRSTSSFGQPVTGLGLHRSLQRNPWAPFINHRPSHSRLREAPSNSHLRGRSSRSQLRNQPSPSPLLDFQGSDPFSPPPQGSRPTLNHVPSHQRLPRRQSSRALQAAQAAALANGSVPSNGSAPRRLSAEETQRRGSELARQRAAQLGQRNSIEPVTMTGNSPSQAEALRLFASTQNAQPRTSLASPTHGASFSDRSTNGRSTATNGSTEAPTTAGQAFETLRPTMARSRAAPPSNYTPVQTPIEIDINRRSRDLSEVSNSSRFSSLSASSSRAT